MTTPADEVLTAASVMSAGHGNKTIAAVPGSLGPPQTKRSRIQLSCTHCRHAKLKCNREKPCAQCVKKGRASLCTFPPSVPRKKPAARMQNRLDHLESLVKGVMTSQPPDAAHNDSASNSNTSQSAFILQLQMPIEAPKNIVEQPTSTNNAVSSSSGQILLALNETTYVGATHWAAMLDDIEEVKSYFNEVELEDPLPEGVARPDLSLVFSSRSSTRKEDLLAALPEQSIVDQLIYRYFNSNSPALHIIHKPTFQTTYTKFWADPYSTPISWLALIYSMMCLATFAALGAGEENADTRGTPMAMIQIYRESCIQSLVLSSYAQPGPYTLETFLLYIEGEFVISKGDQMNCYLIIGVAVRLAMRMGLHRDSDNIRGNITPFQGEIRRRIWHFLAQMDLLVSFHIGLPSMVQAIRSDTLVPLNLRDQDLDEDITELPPSRPETEITGMSYTLAKGRIARVFGKVVEQANLLALPHHDEVMALDYELIQAFAAVPPLLRVIPIALSITDSPQLIMQRLSLAVLFHKSRCVLHRKYLMKEKDDVKFSCSKKLGIEASMELLSIQSEVHDAVRPGGPLCKEMWFISSLGTHDLLLAGMIVYLSLVKESEGIALTAGALQIPSTQQIEMINALEKSHRIWTETKSMSVDIRKVCDLLGSIMKRVNSIFRCPGGDKNDTIDDENGEYMSSLSLNEPGTNGVFDLVDERQYQSIDDLIPLSSLATQPDLTTMFTPRGDLGAIIDRPSDFDWDFFDSHIRQPQINDQAWPDTSFPDFLQPWERL